MAIWSGRRKALTILLFLTPTILGILAFSVYPIIFNTYISTTNRNLYHPNPDCTVTATAIFEPTCWPMFREKAAKGLGTPFTVQSPIYANYSSLIGKLFSKDALLPLLVVVATLLPLYAVTRVNRHYSRQLERPVTSGMVWVAGAAAIIAIGYLLNTPHAISTLMNSSDFLTVTFRTVLYVVLCIPLFFIVGLILALILNSPHLRGRTVFRVIAIVPWAASTVAIMMSLIWQFFFRQQGTINQLFALLGGTGPAWLTNPTLAFGVIVLVNVWYSYPFFMLVILGALQSIPPEQYEAAEVDGATWWHKLTRITLPLIRPAVLPATVLSSITTFQMFGTVYAITQGGPSRGAGVPGATDLVMVYGYKQIFQTQAYGRMGAYAVLIFVFLFFATLYSLRVTRITKGAYE